MPKKMVIRKKNPVKELIVETPKIIPKKTSKRLPLFFLILVVLAGAIFLIVKMTLAATVNGQIITRFAVIKELEQQGGQKTLDVIILKDIITQEAEKKKIIVSQKDLDAELKKIEDNISSQGATLDQMLAQQGLTRSSLAEEIKIQLYLNKLVANDVKVTDKEIDDYLASQNDQASLTPSQQLTRTQASEQIKQQKYQEKVQNYITDLKSKAKIHYFINY
jgi:foldase protein PrsA